MLSTEKINLIKSAVANDTSSFIKIINSPPDERGALIIKIADVNSINLSSSEISELIELPSEIIDGLQLSDEEMSDLAGGKGDSSVNIGGNVMNSNVSSKGGNTNVDPSVGVKM